MFIDFCCCALVVGLVGSALRLFVFCGVACRGVLGLRCVVKLLGLVNGVDIDMLGYVVCLLFC